MLENIVLFKIYRDDFWRLKSVKQHLLVNIQDLSHLFGFKAKLDKEYIDALKQRGLKIFKLADSNKAPHLVLMHDFLEFIKSQSDEQ